MTQEGESSCKSEETGEQQPTTIRQDKIICFVLDMKTITVITFYVAITCLLVVVASVLGYDHRLDDESQPNNDLRRRRISTRDLHHDDDNDNDSHEDDSRQLRQSKIDHFGTINDTPKSNPNNDDSKVDTISNMGGNPAKESSTTTKSSSSSSTSSRDVPTAKERCDWLIGQFIERDKGLSLSEEKLIERYHVQAKDSNSYYRSSAHIFWHDFVTESFWNEMVLSLSSPSSPTSSLNDDDIKNNVDTKQLENDNSIQDLDYHFNRKSTWTWVTGDQHLSNFGTWKNRHGCIVYNINDYDEATVYDFQIDITRVAVSIVDHSLSNGLSTEQVENILSSFANSYIDTVLAYIGNEKAYLFELTSETTTGKLKSFLEKVEKKKSIPKQMKKFTITDEKAGIRRFKKGPIGIPDSSTRLAAVPPEREEEIRNAFSSTDYGSTMMKLGWSIREWDDDDFTVIDVAERVGSGVGSYGVARYYVLLKGTDSGILDSGDGDDTDFDNGAVILDVKYQPRASFTRTLTPGEIAWYNVMFPNPAARTVEGQRRLTSYTDPYTGWIMLSGIDSSSGTNDTNDNNSNSIAETALQPFSVRQRSPWKDDFDISSLVDVDDFSEYSIQIAKAMATSHVRGSVAKPPGDFKQVIGTLFRNDTNEKKEKKKKQQKTKDTHQDHHQRRLIWIQNLIRLSFIYHDQVLLDYKCFSEYVSTNYP